MSSNRKCLIIIPTYNEVENVADIIEAVLAHGRDYNVLIVDDNSKDGTSQIVESLILSNPHTINMIKRAGKMGLGTAYIEGFKFGLDHGYDFIFEMDADFSHNPADLPRLLQACESGSDFAIGSRYIKGGGISNWSKDRLILSYGASLYVRFITWMPIKDATAGFICYKADTLRKINLDKIHFTGYAFQIEMKYAAYKKGLKWKEVPIIFSDRIKGTSKMSTNIVKEAIKGVIGLRLKALRGYYD